MESIKNLIRNDEENEAKNVTNCLENFLSKIKTYKLKTWSKMLKIQLESLQKKYNITSTPSTPIKSLDNENIVVFTPSLDEYKFGKIKCPICENLFKHKRSYEAHHLRFHAEFQMDNSVTDPKGKCRLISNITKKTCGKAFSYRGIYRHLKNKHSTDRPSENHKLVGFQVDKVPIPIFVEEGKKLKEWTTRFKQIKSARNNLCDNIEDIILITPQKKVEVENEIVELNSSLISPIVKRTNGSRKMLWSSSPKKNIVCEMNTNDNNELEEDINAIGIFNELDNKNDSKFKNHIIPIKSPIKIKITSSEQIKEDLDTISSEDEEYGPTQFDCEKQNSEKTDLPISNDVIGSSIIEDESNFSFASDVSKNIKVKQREDLFFEIDSDFSEGDTEEFTNRRKKNKAFRRKERNKSSLKIYQLPGNVEFIAAMKNYMKNETIATKNIDNSSINKTFSHLFYQDDCFLKYQVEQNENFNLGNLIKFSSKSFELLKFPLDWLTNTVKNDGIKECFLSI